MTDNLYLNTLTSVGYRMQDDLVGNILLPMIEMNPTSFRSTGYKKSYIHKEKNILFATLDPAISYTKDYLNNPAYLTEFFDGKLLVIIFKLPLEIYRKAVKNDFHLLSIEEKKTIIKYTCLDYGRKSGIEGEVYVQPIMLAILKHPLFEKMFGPMPKDESWVYLSEKDFYNN